MKDTKVIRISTKILENLEKYKNTTLLSKYPNKVYNHVDDILEDLLQAVTEKQEQLTTNQMFELILDKLNTKQAVTVNIEEVKPKIDLDEFYLSQKNN